MSERDAAKPRDTDLQACERHVTEASRDNGDEGHCEPPQELTLVERRVRAPCHHQHDLAAQLFGSVCMAPRTWGCSATMPLCRL